MRAIVIPLRLPRAIVEALRGPRAFVTSIIAPTGGPPITFHILTELGAVIDTELGDQTRTE